MIRKYDTGLVVPAGLAGAAAASVELGPVNGVIQDVRVIFAGGQNANCHTVVSCLSEPVQPILTLDKVNGTGGYCPKAPTHDLNGAPLTYDGIHPVYDDIPVAGLLTVAWSNANPVACRVIVYVKV